MFDDEAIWAGAGAEVSPESVGCEQAARARIIARSPAILRKEECFMEMPPLDEVLRREQ
jgi:hypothetical protein